MAIAFHESPSLRMLVIEAERRCRRELSDDLAALGHQVSAVGSLAEASNLIAWTAFDLVFLDLRLLVHGGNDFLSRLLQRNPWTRLVGLAGYAKAGLALDALHNGAAICLRKPFKASQIQRIVSMVIERRQKERRVEALRMLDEEQDPEADLPTAEPAMAAAIDLARRVAATHASLLITGEPGTGKLRLARAIHYWSDRAAEPFGVVNCRSGPDRAIEADLFGDAHGAKALDRRGCKVECCDGGTIVLQEIGGLSNPSQAKILRLIESQEFERLNESVTRRADVRVLATTSLDLRQSARRSALRDDLMLSLNVVQIDIPPLRSRPKDIPLLANRFLSFLRRRSGVGVTGFAAGALQALQRHPWPGNDRELRNVVESAGSLCKSGRIEAHHLPPQLSASDHNASLAS